MLTALLGVNATLFLLAMIGRFLVAGDTKDNKGCIQAADGLLCLMVGIANVIGIVIINNG